MWLRNCTNKGQLEHMPYISVVIYSIIISKHSTSVPFSTLVTLILALRESFQEQPWWLNSVLLTPRDLQEQPSG